MRKPQSNSVLKTAHPEKQLALYLFTADRSLAEGVELVQKEFGTKTYSSSLSEWRSYHPFSKKLTEFKDGVTAAVESLKKDPEMDKKAELLSKASQVAFEVV